MSHYDEYDYDGMSTDDTFTGAELADMAAHDEAAQDAADDARDAAESNR